VTLFAEAATPAALAKMRLEESQKLALLAGHPTATAAGPVAILTFKVGKASGT
jgi:hypothetical protein